MSGLGKRWTAALAIGWLGLGAPVRAEVVESHADGIKLKQVLNIAAPPDKVYAAFIDIGRWWDPAHTYSSDSANLRLEARAGGCFCETLPNGGGVVHMTVVYVVPGQRLTLSGALGPLQIFGVAGAMTIQMLPKEQGTQFGLLYNVGGFYPGGLKAVAGDIDAVLGEQVLRLQRFVETGEPAEKKAEAKP